MSPLEELRILNQQYLIFAMLNDDRNAEIILERMSDVQLLVVDELENER
jgi:hypothetical protein